MPMKKVGSATPISDRTISTWLKTPADERGPDAERNAERDRDQHGTNAARAWRVTAPSAARTGEPKRYDTPKSPERVPLSNRANCKTIGSSSPNRDALRRDPQARRLPHHVIHRIADVAEHHETDERHREHDEDRLSEPVNDVRSTGKSSLSVRQPLSLAQKERERTSAWVATELDAKRQLAQKEKRKPAYDGTCRPPEGVIPPLPADKPMSFGSARRPRARP